MAFIESPRFPDDIARGLLARRRWSTRKLVGDNGWEQRVQLWQSSRKELECRLWVYDDASLAAIVAFVEQTRGDLHGFRVRDWSDFCAGYVYLGGGAYQTSTPAPLGVGNGTNRVFDLVAVYGSGTYAATRRIFKPRSGETNAPLVALVNGSAASATFDAANGRVTLASAPASGAAVAWRGVFDMPARFDGDVLETDLKAATVGQTNALKLIEIRV